MASTRVTPGIARFMACSIPARRVISLIGHSPHAPSNSSSTTISGVMSSNLTESTVGHQVRPDGIQRFIDSAM